MAGYFYLSEDEFTIHKHGQGTKMKKHFICTKILCNNIIWVDAYDGKTKEKMEIVCEVVGPACLPHSQGLCFWKLSLEAAITDNC
jgi:hypothetical protein